MQRRTLDRLISLAGLTLAAVLIASGVLLSWAHNYVRDEVSSQLVAQKIYFPSKDSSSISAPEYAQVRQYAGQQLTTGDQAKVYADHFIANHLQGIGGGKTYSQLSTQAQADPTNTKLAATVNTMFKGETLRGLLLNAYAFDTMGVIAGIAALVAYAGAAVLLLLATLGLWHGRRARRDETVLTAVPMPVAVGV